MNVESRTEVAQFLFWECINEIFVAVRYRYHHTRRHCRAIKHQGAVNCTRRGGLLPVPTFLLLKSVFCVHIGIYQQQQPQELPKLAAEQPLARAGGTVRNGSTNHRPSTPLLHRGRVGRHGGVSSLWSSTSVLYCTSNV
jgi:hypothetical protein